MNRDHPECATLEQATHQAPPGHFAVESENDDCPGCALSDERGNCSRRKTFGPGADDRYPCVFDPTGGDADDGPESEPKIYFHFKPLSEWKFGNEE